MNCTIQRLVETIESHGGVVSPDGQNLRLVGKKVPGALCAEVWRRRREALKFLRDREMARSVVRAVLGVFPAARVESTKFFDKEGSR